MDSISCSPGWREASRKGLLLEESRVMLPETSRVVFNSRDQPSSFKASVFRWVKAGITLAAWRISPLQPTCGELEAEVRMMVLTLPPPSTHPEINGGTS